MTDRDELASAYLDGEVTPAERAAVEGDPTVMARVDELRSVRAVLRAPDRSSPTDERDAAIATAVAAADTLAPQRGRQPAGGDVHPLQPASRPQGTGGGRRRVLIAIGGVAAAAVIAVGVVVSLSRSASTPTAGPDASATTAAAAAPALTAAGRPATAGAPSATTAAPAPSPATTAPTAPTASTPLAPSGAAANALPLADLGVLTDAASVRRALASSAAQSKPAADPCSLTPARLAGRAKWNGTAVYVYVLGGRAVVIAIAGCERLVEVPLS